MKIELGDKLLCRQTFYNEKGDHIWQIGRYYEITSTNNNLWKKYAITSELVIPWIATENELKHYFLIDKKKLRRYKLYKINKSNES